MLIGVPKDDFMLSASVTTFALPGWEFIVERKPFNNSNHLHYLQTLLLQVSSRGLVVMLKTLKLE